MSEQFDTDAVEPVYESDPGDQEQTGFDEGLGFDDIDWGEASAAMERRVAGADDEFLADPDEELVDVDGGDWEDGADPALGYDGHDQNGNGIQDPRVPALIDYLEAKEQQEQRNALNRLAEEHPELHDEEVLSGVVEELAEISERAGNADLLMDPWAVSQALKLVQHERAAAAEVPAERARMDGAALEIAAGASEVDHDASYDATAKSELRAAAQNMDLP